MIVTQEWTHDLPMMQQTVLLTAIRGPDGVPKYHPSKYMLRWYRRCVLYGALDHNIFKTPYDPRGGSFTGPSFLMHGPSACWATGQKMPEAYQPDEKDDWITPMQAILDTYLRSLDELPHHFQLHFMHAAEIVGYKHPDERIRSWWRHVYQQLVHDMHLNPESEEQMDFRLADSEAQWRSTSSTATQE